MITLSGAELEARSNDGSTALHLAASKGHVEVMQLLMDRSADLDALNIAARSPLHVAILSSQQDAALFLLKNGVEVDGTDGLGKVSSHAVISRACVSE